MYNDDVDQLMYMVEKVQLGNGKIQVNYLSSDGNVLLMQAEGKESDLEVTYTLGDDPNFVTENANGRIDGWGGRFLGCLKALAMDETFLIVALAGAIVGVGAYVAAGAAIGCGLRAMDYSNGLRPPRLGNGQITNPAYFNRINVGLVPTSSSYSNLIGYRILIK